MKITKREARVLLSALVAERDAVCRSMHEHPWCVHERSILALLALQRRIARVRKFTEWGGR